MTLIMHNGTVRTSLITLFSAALVIFFAVGCQESTIIEPDANDEPEAAARPDASNNAQSGETVKNFVAPLSGDQEVPPVETNATGVTTFKLSKDGTALSYKLNVANIEDAFAAHIHCAPFGENGPVGVTLHAGLIEGKFQGTLAEDTISTPDDGNDCGWADLDDVLAAVSSGDTYVNVHTEANPGGEIRGQIDRGNGVAR